MNATDLTQPPLFNEMCIPTLDFVEAPLKSKSSRQVWS